MKSKKVLKIVVVIAFIIATLGIGLWDKNRKEKVVKAPDNKVVIPINKKVPVIDYDKIHEDKDLKTMMDERKEQLGVEKSVDMVLKPDETLKVGDNTVSMREIIDDIEVETGEVVEHDLMQNRRIKEAESERREIIESIEKQEQEYKQLEEQIFKAIDDDERTNIISRLEKMGPTVNTYREYKRANSSLDKRLSLIKEEKQGGSVIAKLKLEIETLRSKIGRYEKTLGIPSLPDENKDVYGIYIAKKGDSIWNIHFRFLKEYFNSKGINISYLSDEPDQKGFSSGVGKLLKFSENIVSIYNLAERRIDADIDILRPKSKIVIYKMKSVFEMLDQIDYKKVNNIKFDGDTLWIPAG